MIEVQTIQYTKGDLQMGFSGIVELPHFFFVFETFAEQFTNERGNKYLEKIIDEMQRVSIDSLSQFEQFITDCIKKEDLPLDFSMSVGYLKDGILYIKTTNDGTIFARRKGKWVKLLDKDMAASGYGEPEDLYLFTTSYFSLWIEGIPGVQKLIGNHEITEIEEKLDSKEIPSNQKYIGLFLRLTKKKDLVANVVEPTQVIEDLPVKLPKAQIKFPFLELIHNTVYTLKEKFSYMNSNPLYSKKKKLTFFMVLIVLIILIWSVGFGYQRRHESQQQAFIDKSREEINQKLKHADNIAITDLPQALILISDAKNSLELLKGKLNKQTQIIDVLALNISSEESKLLKKEQKNAQEYYDLSLENKSAQGEKLFLDSDILGILDSKNNSIYELSLVKKSFKKHEFIDIKDASLISLYQNQFYFYAQGKGIYKIDENDKIKKIIANDSEWGRIVSMWVYLGNIYILDSGKQQIYKYLVAEGGYSEKKSYLTAGPDIRLGQANSLSIDSSIYTGLDSLILKFSSGEQDSFKSSIPESSIQITKIFTSKDLVNIFAWDKNNGGIYILDKSGEYVQQITSSVLKEAKDFVVLDKTIYILRGNKIYSISID